MFDEAQIRSQIEARNAIRGNAKLPLVSVDDELDRMKQVSREAEFEDYFQKQKHRFKHLWADPTRGWFGNIAVYSKVRKQLRDEFEGERVAY